MLRRCNVFLLGAMSDQEKPQEDQDFCQAGAKRESSSSRPSRASMAYWRDRVYLPSSGSGGQCPNYGARIAYQGKRVFFSLDTPNKDAAAARAVTIFKFLTSHGWEETLFKYKPHKVTNPRRLPDTVGALIEAATELSTARPQTKEAYAKALRRIVADIVRIDGKGRYDARHGGNERWKRKVDRVKLSRITPDKVIAWKNGFMDQAGGDALDRRARGNTVNGLLTNASALFSKKFRRFLADRVLLPDPLPFEGVPKEKGRRLRYISKIDANAILESAQRELAPSHPEAFKIILLAAVCGLRRSEIDYLLWEKFDFRRRELHIESTEYHQLKSEDSEGVVDLDENLVTVFQGFYARAKGEFVIESSGSLNRKPGSGSYRCGPHWKTVISWLREKGVKAQKPVHELRKEIGSIIADQHGIYAASRYLRHSDIRITAQYYLDKKTRITPALSASIVLEDKIVPMPTASSSESGLNSAASSSQLG